MNTKYTTLYLSIWLSMLMAHSEATPAAPTAADLAMTLTAAPDPVIVNGQLTYTLTVRNEGQKAAKTINVTDILPIETQYLSASPGCKATKFKKTKKIVCKLKKLEPGLSSSWTVSVKPIGAGSVVNHANVKALGRDANTLNNDASVSTEVVLKLNQQPLAESVSLSVDLAVSKTITQQLVATDADNDTLVFELLAPANGTGYTQASANAQTGVLTLTLVEGFAGVIVLPFRATDGKEFSNTAEVTITVVEAQEERRTGALDVDPIEYANIASSRLESDLLGAPGAESTEPPSVDLTAFLPLPRSQGQQGSCVAWATGYALKSYQEGSEIGWPLDMDEHLFSPAYIYNQINHGQDQGSQVYDAMQLIIDQGAASLAAMPYNDNDYLSQPSQAARNEAFQFKAISYERVNNTGQVKAALINKQPVVWVIRVNDYLKRLGNNAVYNTVGNFNGLHAVTVVGYDNHKFGGAFKIINSWGKTWGDQGYFWLPYDFVSPIVTQGYRLIDKENTIVPPPPPPPSGLPNLEAEDWSATYDPNPGGKGSLEWEVVNTGTGTAPAGVSVNLLLSRNEIISINDTYLVFEQIPGITKPGGSWYRDAENPISFTFPSYLESGEYYMALWIDDLDEIAESNEDDNVSFRADTLSIVEPLPDLSVDSWSAEWSNSTGEGTLYYEILNTGSQAAPAPYDVNLVLSSNQEIGDGDEYFLFFETITHSLPSGYIQYRDENSPAYFNLFKSQRGTVVPAGVYNMAVWVDDLNQIAEANETNNWSKGGDSVEIGRIESGAKALNLQEGGHDGVSRAYNGKKLPSGRVLAMKKVKISETPEGGRKMEILEAPQMQADTQHTFSKSIRAQNKVIFPVVTTTPMAPAK